MCLCVRARIARETQHSPSQMGAYGGGEKGGDEIEAESRCSDKRSDVLLKVNMSLHIRAPLMKAGPQI